MKPDYETRITRDLQKAFLKYDIKRVNAIQDIEDQLLLLLLCTETQRPFPDGVWL